MIILGSMNDISAKIIRQRHLYHEVQRKMYTKFQRENILLCEITETLRLTHEHVSEVVLTQVQPTISQMQI